MTSDEICFAILHDPAEFEVLLFSQLSCGCADKPTEKWRHRLLKEFWRGPAMLIYRKLVSVAAQRFSSAEALFQLFSDAWALDPQNVKRFFEFEQGAHDAIKLFCLAKSLADTSCFAVLHDPESDLAGARASMQTAAWLYSNRHISPGAQPLRCPLPAAPSREDSALMLAFVGDEWLHRKAARSIITRRDDPTTPLSAPIQSDHAEDDVLTHSACAHLLVARAIEFLPGANTGLHLLRSASPQLQWMSIDATRNAWHWNASLAVAAFGEWLRWTVPPRH